MGKRTKQIVSMLFISVLFLLVGCSKGYIDSRREIDRIYRAAERFAEKRAAGYIFEKYGISAVPQGHWVQANYDLYTPYINPNVIVFMVYGDKKFCVGVHVDDETILWDNYQKEEIEAVLQGHLINLYSLPQPYTIKTEFRLEHTPNYKSFVPAEWRDKGYSHTNMVDFFFSGQPVEELLSQIGYLEYFVSYLSLDRPLDEIEFKAKDWPVSEGGYIAWNFRRYASPEAELVDTDVNHPKIAGFPHFKEWLHTVLKHKGTEGQEMVKDYFEFHTTVAEGITFITILPHEMGDILYISEGKDAWAVDPGNGNVQTYQLVSSLFEVTEKAPDSYYIAAMSVPAAFTEQYKNPLYILSRNKETGKIMAEAYISSQEELDNLPETEHNRNYKFYINGIKGMTKGFQYAVAERIEDSGEKKL
jgi:hypothetical protein